VILQSPAPAVIPGRAAFVVISWNNHVGGGDLTALVNDLRAGRLTATPPADFVLLLQEAYRGGDAVPPMTGAARSAPAQTPSGAGGGRTDVVAAARALGLSLFYVPSMRNGTRREDRGSAILASASLREWTALVLPLEKQRRVAAVADLTVGGEHGFDLRFVSAHFTNVVPARLWLFSEPGRVRQARALARLLRDREPTILGGDLNSWFGFNDAGYRELARVFTSPRPSDRRPTFGPMRLDHVLYRLPNGWRGTVRRLDSRYSSDHYPVLAVFEPPPAG
jgi:endonuclease/exonuclease/phosphatase family metal-dependent hydrolase